MHHQDHDVSLIVGLAADDLPTSERSRAQHLIDSCAECSLLRDDLVAIARATRTLPAMSAPRDFRITADQAARLRRTGWIQRLLRPIAGPNSIARPLAATFSTLGLVGVLVASAVPGMLGGAASMAPEAAGGGTPVTAPAMSSEAPAPQFGPAATAASGGSDYGAKDNVQASAAPLVGQGTGGTGSSVGSDGDGTTRDLATFGGDLGSTANPTPTSVGTPLNPVLVGSVAMLAVGLLLFGLRFAGRRLS